MKWLFSPFPPAGAQGGNALLFSRNGEFCTDYTKKSPCNFEFRHPKWRAASLPNLILKDFDSWFAIVIIRFELYLWCAAILPPFLLCRSSQTLQSAQTAWWLFKRSLADTSERAKSLMIIQKVTYTLEPRNDQINVILSAEAHFALLWKVLSAEILSSWLGDSAGICWDVLAHEGRWHRPASS